MSRARLLIARGIGKRVNTSARYKKPFKALTCERKQGGILYKKGKVIPHTHHVTLVKYYTPNYINNNQVYRFKISCPQITRQNTRFLFVNNVLLHHKWCALQPAPSNTYLKIKGTGPRKCPLRNILFPISSLTSYSTHFSFSLNNNGFYTADR